jgi:hypothetical protein
MTDDKPLGGDTPYPALYDYFKHLTTVSLIAIGGVLGLLQGDGPRLGAPVVIVIMALLAAAGTIAMIMLAMLSTLSLRHDSSTPEQLAKRLLAAQGAATLALMIGLGLFVGAFLGAIT